jgi:hypothetical protein
MFLKSNSSLTGGVWLGSSILPLLNRAGAPHAPPYDRHMYRDPTAFGLFVFCAYIGNADYRAL